MLGVKSDLWAFLENDAIAGHVKASLDAHSVGYSHCRSYAGENGFEGWYTSDNQKAINTMRVRGSIELTAKWSVPHKVEQDITDNNRDNNGGNNITVTPSVKKAVIKSAVKEKRQSCHQN